jgi:flagellar biosynthesis protein FlhA
LVSQIPALIVSTAAGVVVTKAGISGATDKLMFSQFSTHPKALGLTSFFLIILSFAPGIPTIPFFILSLCLGLLAYSQVAGKRKARNEIAQKPMPPGLGKMQSGASGQSSPIASSGGQNPSPPAPTSTEETIASALKIDSIRLELGYGLLNLVRTTKPGATPLLEQIMSLRKQLASEFGFVLPSVRVQDNIQNLESQDYAILIKEIEAATHSLKPNYLLAVGPAGGKLMPLRGEQTKEPVLGAPSIWIQESQRSDALSKGYNVIDPQTVIVMHLSEVVKDNMADLLSYRETQRLFSGLDKDYQKMISDFVPSQINFSTIQRVLQNLLSERISIRDLPTILEAIFEIVPTSRSIPRITEHVRSKLAWQICDQYADPSGILSVVTLSSEWERAFLESLIGSGEEKQLALAPSLLQEFVRKSQDVLGPYTQLDHRPIVLTSPQVRLHIRNIMSRIFPYISILSQNEIHIRCKIKQVGQI